MSNTLDVVRARLAPRGVLRVALNEANFLLVPTAAAEGRGVAADLGRELAARLGVPAAFIGYADAGKVADAAVHDVWDVAFIGADPARSDVNFSPAYVHIDATYLVRESLPIIRADEVDRAGIRIAVANRSAYHLVMQRIIRAATMVAADGLPASEEVFRAQGLEALAGLRPHLVDVATRIPDVRLVDGVFMSVAQSIGVPRDREGTAPWVADFVRDVLASGLVTRLVLQHGVRGVTVPAVEPGSGEP